MSALMTLLLAMQYVVSVKAGLVNHVEGRANVTPMDMVRLERPIVTGANGFVEILLTPGAFLRMGEHSEVVLEGVELDDVRVRVVSGPAVIEVVDISKHTPITVKTGELTTKVTQNGVFRFEDGTATVLHGRLETADRKLEYEKGWQIFYQDNYRARKATKLEITSLDVYSDHRSAEISRANMTLASTLRSPADVDVWLLSPTYGWYTYIPRDNYRSPYGYRYNRVGQYVNYSRPSSGSNSSSGSSASNSGTTSSGGNSNSNNDSGGGGVSAAPAVTVSAPSGERSAPAVYIESKNTPGAASQ